MDEEDVSLVKRLLSALVIVLLISGGLKVFEDLQSNPSACQSDNATTLDLSNLALLPFSTSSNTGSSQDLLNSSYWSMVDASYGKTIETPIPQTVVGFLQSSNTWKNWTLENMADPPPWVESGPIPAVDQELRDLQSDAINSSNSGQALGYVTNFAASISGYSLAALDYVTFDGLTSLKTLFQTGSTEEALCASFPGQLAQLYKQGFESGEPSQVSAQSLGTALAITSVIALLGGLGGFSDKFQVALAGSGLDGVWDTIKPSLDDLGTISPTAANLALVVLQKVALQFPASIGSEAGLVSFRIDSMADVLHSAGDTDSDIEQKISELAQAVDSASGPDDIAVDADDISFEDGHGLEVVVGEQNHLYWYTDAKTMRYFGIDTLQKVIPGFVPRDPMFLKVYYFQEGVFTFNYYSGGETWTATVPSAIAQPGEKLTIYIQELTVPGFVASIPKLSFLNVASFRWMPHSAEIDSFSLNGDILTLTGSEKPSIEGASTFSIQTEVEGTLQFAPGQGPYLQIGVTDMFGQVRDMRIYFNGYGEVSLRMQAGSKFPPVSMLSYDGVRLSFVYGSPTLSIATIYESSPAGFYDLGAMGPQPLDFTIPGVSQTWQISEVTLNRQFETNLLDSSSNYAHGRLGAETAYAVAIERIGLTDVVIGEPSQGGPDLWTQDEGTVLEARFLTSSAGASLSGPDALNELLETQLTQMVNRISNTDFITNPTAVVGYAILTYLDSSGHLHTIVLEVLNK